jgi:hypothetical protein
MLAQLARAIGNRHKDSLIHDPRAVGTGKRKEILQVDNVVMSNEYKVVRLALRRQCIYARDDLRTSRNQSD